MSRGDASIPAAAVALTKETQRDTGSGGLQESCLSSSETSARVV